MGYRGKAPRLVRTLLGEWAYARPFADTAERIALAARVPRLLQPPSATLEPIRAAADQPRARQQRDGEEQLAYSRRLPSRRLLLTETFLVSPSSTSTWTCSTGEIVTSRCFTSSTTRRSIATCSCPQVPPTRMIWSQRAARSVLRAARRRSVGPEPSSVALDDRAEDGHRRASAAGPKADGVPGYAGACRTRPPPRT